MSVESDYLFFEVVTTIAMGFLALLIAIATWAIVHKKEIKSIFIRGSIEDLFLYLFGGILIETSIVFISLYFIAEAIPEVNPTHSIIETLLMGGLVLGVLFPFGSFSYNSGMIGFSPLSEK